MRISVSADYVYKMVIFSKRYIPNLRAYEQ